MGGGPPAPPPPPTPFAPPHHAYFPNPLSHALPHITQLLYPIIFLSSFIIMYHLSHHLFFIIFLIILLSSSYHLSHYLSHHVFPSSFLSCFLSSSSHLLIIFLPSSYHLHLSSYCHIDIVFRRHLLKSREKSSVPKSFLLKEYVPESQIASSVPMRCCCAQRSKITNRKQCVPMSP